MLGRGAGGGEHNTDMHARHTQSHTRNQHTHARTAEIHEHTHTTHRHIHTTFNADFNADHSGPEPAAYMDGQVCLLWGHTDTGTYIPRQTQTDTSTQTHTQTHIDTHSNTHRHTHTTQTHAQLDRAHS